MDTKAYQTVVCATEDTLWWLKTHVLLGELHQLLVCPSSVGPNCRQQLFFRQWARAEAAFTFSFCTNTRWSRRANKTVLGLGLHEWEACRSPR